MNRRSTKIVVCAAFALLSCGNSAVLADEWGYDQPKEVQPMKAVALPMKRTAAAKPAAAKPAGAKPAVPGKPSALASHVVPTAPRTVPAHAGAPKAVAPGAKIDYATECWSQIYQIASGKKLTDDERTRLTDIVKKTPSRQNATAFWPKVTEYLVVHPEQKENYVRLLRALLRWRARTLVGTTDSAAPPAVAKEEAALIGEALGPERVAVQGSPSFSEEAVEAYADMACFLYEQNNPGKTIDAFDNRAMFASVVCDKFRNAPTEKDKRAMAAFDLSWAKFRVAWDAANESTRKEMLAALQKTGAGSASIGHDPMLQSILQNWTM